MDIMEKLKECYEHAGISIANDTIVEDSVSSISLVTVFVELENEFDICIPDQYLSIETIASLDFMLDLIESLIKDNAHEI